MSQISTAGGEVCKRYACLIWILDFGLKKGAKSFLYPRIPSIPVNSFFYPVNPVYPV
jgi:hypothetical protein